MSLSQEDLIAFQQALLFSSCDVSALALIIYDTIITFDQEIDRMWRRKITGATVIFFFVRYLYIGSTVMTVIIDLGQQSVMRCTATNRLFYAFEIMATLATAVFSSFRVWAIWGRQWWPFFVILLMTLVTPIANAILGASIQVFEVSSLPPPFGGCGVEYTLSPETLPRVGVAVRALAIVVDVLVLVATWTKTFGIHRTLAQTHNKARLSTLLLRDGTMYFGALLIVNILMLAFDITDPLGNPVLSFLDSITCIMISRLMLNLRGMDVSESDTDIGIQSFASSVVFRALGNVGAPLGNSDMEDDSIGRVSLKQASEDPLSIGLFDDLEQPEVRDIEEEPNEQV